MEWSGSTTERLKSCNTLKQREMNFSICYFLVPKRRVSAKPQLIYGGIKKQDYASSVVQYLTLQPFVQKKASHWIESSF